jgi:hypothetical protein
MTKLLGGAMDKCKSILEKIADRVKEITNIASEAADYALKTEERPPKAHEPSAAYIPLAPDDLVSDPMVVPPRSKTAGKGIAKNTSRKTVEQAVKKAIHGKRGT